MRDEFKNPKIEVDPKTEFVFGSPGYNDYYFYKTENDYMLTKGPFLSYDGKEWPTIEAAEKYNKYISNILLNNHSKPNNIVGYPRHL